MTDTWIEPPRLSVIEEEPKTPDSPTGKEDDERHRICQLLKETYGLLVVDMWPLPSVLPTDLTFKVKGNMAGVIQEFTYKQKLVQEDIKNLEPSGMCSLMFQTIAMEHLRTHHILCPHTLADRQGNLSSIVKTRGMQHLVQLTSYLKGTPLSAVVITPQHLYDVGVLLANLRRSFRTFSNPYVKEEPPEELWERENFKQLLSYLSLIDDDQQKQLVENVILAFCQDFEQKLPQLETGYNHGDLHPANIVLTKTDDTLPVLERYGIIDFALVNYSFQVFDVSVALASFMMAADSESLHFLEAGAYLYAGYQSVEELRSEERDLLYIAVCVLYCKVLFTTIPVKDILADDQSYVGKVARKVGPQLRELWHTPQSTVIKVWEDVKQNYKRH